MIFTAQARSLAAMLNFTGRKSASSGLILLYHRVTTLTSDPWGLCVSPRHFRQHMQWLCENACVVPLTEMQSVVARRRPGRPMVAVTFDDGYADNLHEALPVLEEYGIPATFFLTVPWMDPRGEFWWDELERIFLQPSALPDMLRLESIPEAPTWHLGDVACYTIENAESHKHWRAGEDPPTPRHTIYAEIWKRLYPMLPERRKQVLNEILGWSGKYWPERHTHRRMTRDEISVLSRSGAVEIGAHSVSHAALPAVPRAERKREIELGRRALVEVVDRPITSFAYPHGDYCPETRQLVRQAGFHRGCTTRLGRVQHRQDPFVLPRFGVEDWNLREFGRRMASFSKPDSA